MRRLVMNRTENRHTTIDDDADITDDDDDEVSLSELVFRSGRFMAE